MDAHREALAEAGKSLPRPVHGLALVDTGATTTCIDQDAAGRARLPTVGHGSISSASHSGIEVPIYAASLAIPQFMKIEPALGCLGANIPDMDVIVLIGRDVLADTVLVYHGHDGMVSMSI